MVSSLRGVSGSGGVDSQPSGLRLSRLEAKESKKVIYAVSFEPPEFSLTGEKDLLSARALVSVDNHRQPRENKQSQALRIRQAARLRQKRLTSMKIEKNIVTEILPRKKVQLLIFLLCLQFVSLAYPQAKPSLTPEDVLRQLESRMKAITSLQAEFKQFYYSSASPEPLTGQGKFYLRKPDRMRWEYEAPEKQIFLYQRGQFWLYFPEDKQLIKNAVDSPGHESEILSLISGTYSITERYSPSFNPFPSDRQDVYQLKLTPKEEGEFRYLLLEIDRKTWLITKAVFFDQAGNKLEYWFTRLKTNLPLPDKLFELKVPPDGEIIESSGPKKPGGQAG